MHASPVLLTLWAICLFGFVAVMVYRATLTNHETGQLFLAEEDYISSQHAEDDAIDQRVRRLVPAAYGFGGATALMTVALLVNVLLVDGHLTI